MAKGRTSRQSSASLRAKVVKLEAALEACEHAVHKLQAENQTHIKRMGAMQAEIDHLRGKGNGQPAFERPAAGAKGAIAGP